MALPDFADSGTALTAFLAALTTWLGFKIRKAVWRQEAAEEELPHQYPHSLAAIRQDISRLEAEQENLAKQQPDILARLHQVRHEMFNEMQKQIADVKLVARDLEKRVRYAELDLARMGSRPPPKRSHSSGSADQ